MNTQTFQPKTFNWQPPTDLPNNWKIIHTGEDGGAYKNRTGIIVIISCCVERDGKNWVHLSLPQRLGSDRISN